MTKRRNRSKNKPANTTHGDSTHGDSTHGDRGKDLGGQKELAGQRAGQQQPAAADPPADAGEANPAGAQPDQPAAPQPAGTQPADSQAADAQPSAAGDGANPFRRMLLPSLSRIMSVVMLVIGILVVGMLFYQVMIGFFVPLFLAALLVVLFRPVFLWLLEKTKGRQRLSAGLTTTIILLIVLLPLAMLVSIATTQFTVLLSRMNGSVSVAMDRVRGQLGMELPHAEYFRELDRVADSLGISGPPVLRPLSETAASRPAEFARKANTLEKAAAIIGYLQAAVEGPAAAEQAAEKAIEDTRALAAAIRSAEQQPLEQRLDGADNPLLRLDASEQFEQHAVITAASIRSWMHLKLGGALHSQLKLLANPDEADFARLIRTARESLQPRFVRLTSATGSMLVHVLFGSVILVISVYFFLIDGPVMIATLMRLSPMDDAYELRLLMEFDRTSRAVVLATVASAVVQGVLATLGFWLCGFDQIVLLLFLTTLTSLVPFLGAAAVWVPCALWLGVVDQRWLAAALLGLWGATVVSSIDNVIKVYVLQGRSQLHPLFALLSVIGGVSVFGPIGILVGPMVVVFLQTLLEILNHELKAEGAGGPAMALDQTPQPERT